MKNKDIGVLILMTAIIFIALAFIVGTANTVKLVSTKTAVANESLSIAAARLAGGVLNSSYELRPAYTSTSSGWRLNAAPECDVTSIILLNQSQSPMTAGVQYTYTSVTGVVKLNNTAVLNSSSSNTTYVSYSYCADTYVPGSSNKSVIGLIVLFAVIGLLIFVVVRVLKMPGTKTLSKFGEAE